MSEKNPKKHRKNLSILDTDKAKLEVKAKNLNSKSKLDDKIKIKDKKKPSKKHHSSTKEILKQDYNKINISKSKISRKESDKIIDVATTINEKKEKQKQFDDFELNEMEYEEALKHDHRSCWCMYYSLIKREHRIIFTFFVYHDYNLVPVKYSRFIFLLATDMCMNVFFFSDATMHKIFLNYGKYNFLQQIPQILYSTIVSQIIEILLCFLSLTDKHMYEIKNLDKKKRNIKEVNNIFNTMSRKLFFYFLITFISFLVYWYIVCVFCAVYENTQIAYIKDSFISSLFGFILPLILYLFPAAFRGCALKCKNNNCLYKTSDLIPFF